jgi:hypothetical protein
MIFRYDHFIQFRYDGYTRDLCVIIIDNVELFQGRERIHSQSDFRRISSYILSAMSLWTMLTYMWNIRIYFIYTIYVKTYLEITH